VHPYAVADGVPAQELLLPIIEAAAGVEVPNPFTYTGRFLDVETGLYYYRARHYHARLGRLVQRDPGGYVDGLNLYQYARSQPTRHTDPTGARVPDEDHPDYPPNQKPGPPSSGGDGGDERCPCESGERRVTFLEKSFNTGMFLTCLGFQGTGPAGAMCAFWCAACIVDPSKASCISCFGCAGAVATACAANATKWSLVTRCVPWDWRAPEPRDIVNDLIDDLPPGLQPY